MREDFDEGRVSRHLDPLDGQVQDFDWDAVEAGVSGHQPVDEDEILDRLGMAFSRIAQWVLYGQRMSQHDICDKLIGRRFLALVWVLKPGLMEDGLSLAEMERVYGMPKNSLTTYTAQVTRDFGVMNRAQARVWNRKLVEAGAQRLANARKGRGEGGAGQSKQLDLPLPEGSLPPSPPLAPIATRTSRGPAVPLPPSNTLPRPAAAQCAPASARVAPAVAPPATPGGASKESFWPGVSASLGTGQISPSDGSILRAP